MKQTAQLRRRNVCAARIKLPGSALVEYRPKAIFSSLRICDDNGPKGLHAVRCQEEEGKKRSQRMLLRAACSADDADESTRNEYRVN